MQILNVLPLKIRLQCETLFFKDQGAATLRSAQVQCCTQMQRCRTRSQQHSWLAAQGGTRQQGTLQQVHRAVWGGDIFFFNDIFLE